MDIHLLFPFSADVTLCGEIADDEPVVASIDKVTCKRCRQLIEEIARQTLLNTQTQESLIAP